MNTDQTLQSHSEPASSSPKWKPLTPAQRRVAGVLVEKAKTTPEQYPLSLNALTNGCNQKNNRHPVTNLTQDQVAQGIDELRELGAVVEVQGTGRVPKFKHCLYEWLGVEKVELAVMAELLLRGEQTVGELRGRASRMEPIPDLGALRPILAALKEKGLLLELTPEGRGQLVSHNLYKDRELAELRNRVALMPVDSSPAVADVRESPAPAAAASRREVTLDMFNELQLEVAELRAEVARLRGTIQQLTGS
jgi:uncharacterized protein YceH (UPF0502 family)